jgi:hypothetical protein
MALAERRDDMNVIRYGPGGHVEDPADSTRCVWLVPGGGRMKSPGDELLRYMVSIAADLDAWVIGQDGEVYRIDPDGEVRGEWTPPIERWFYMDRPGYRPIPAEEWSELTAAQSDFQALTEIEAHCPSGLRSLHCAPTAHWMGHPSGRPVPFILQSDSVYFPVEHQPSVAGEWHGPITDHGAATFVRAQLIADQLGAEIDD